MTTKGESVSSLGKVESLKLLIVVAQLALLTIVFYQFEIESPAFFSLAILAFLGFIVHALLPFVYRLPFFLILSFSGIVIVLGLVNAIWIILVGLLLIGICHIPVAFWIRGSLLVLVGLVLVAQRAGWLPSLWSNAVWPILGSIFMFRLAVYFYDIRHDKSPGSITQTLSYFFLLPNVCFPLFPVIDYKTFRRNYYDNDAYQIYQIGVDWMARGVLHLILYRYVYLHLTLAPNEVFDAGDLVRYMLSTFLLYLRISGQFHLVIGMLYLFGFSLPETHHRYLLAAGFTDFWRRINIYWKDFMMKLVYYPSFFKLRGRGTRAGMIGATIIVFFVTWITHSYQWFWLRGGFPIEMQDVLFWGILGALVIYGSLRELNRPKQRSVSKQSAVSFSLVVKTLATFCAICFLWSIWSADSMMSWLTMFIVSWHFSISSLIFIAVVFGGLVLATVAQSFPALGTEKSLPFYRQQAVYSNVLLIAMLAIGSTGLYINQFPLLGSTVESLKRTSLNSTDAALQHKGYYEKLDSDSRTSAQLLGVQAQKPKHWVGLNETAAYRRRDDIIVGDLQPGANIVFEDKTLSVNRWGMRDRDRELDKPANTYRIAVLGPSHVMGSGVNNGETFPDFLEQRLNANATNSNTRFEVMNFGVAGFSLIQQLAMLEDRALQFKPDAVFITDSPRATDPIPGHLLNFLAAGHKIPYPELDAKLQKIGVNAVANDGFPVPFETLRSLCRIAGIKTRMPWKEADRRVHLINEEILNWTIGRIAEVSRQNGAVPVFVALDEVTDTPTIEVKALKDAKGANMLVFNLFDLWDGRDKASLRIGAWDLHPNAEGYKLVAERLTRLIDEHRKELRINTNVPIASNGTTTQAKDRYYKN